MTPEQFCYWLQGYTEMGGPAPTPEQWQMIKSHLATVFNKVTPPLVAPFKPLSPFWDLFPPSVPSRPNDPVYWKPEITC